MERDTQALQPSTTTRDFAKRPRWENGKLESVLSLDHAEFFGALSERRRPEQCSDPTHISSRRF